MGQAFVEADFDGDLLGEAPRQDLEGPFVMGRAAAEQDKLKLGREHLLQGAEQQIDPLLVRQARDGGKQRDARFFRQAKFLLQFDFVRQLAFKVMRRVREFQVRVVRRVPFLVIDAVEDSRQRGLALPQNRVQAATEGRRRDFTGVTRTDRGDDVRENDACLQAAQEAVKLHAVRVEIVGWQVGELVKLAGKVSLITEVVDGQAGARHPAPPFGQFLVQYEDRRQRGLPILHVDDFRLPGQVARQVGHAFGKENETLRIVRIFLAILQVQRAAMIIPRLLDKIGRHSGSGFEGPDFGLHPLPAHRQIDVPVELFELGKTLQDAGVKRSDDPHLMSGAAQRFGERRHHVSQAAALGKRVNFAAGQEDFHPQYLARKGRPSALVLLRWPGSASIGFPVRTARATCRLTRGCVRPGGALATRPGPGDCHRPAGRFPPAPRRAAPARCRCR